MEGKKIKRMLKKKGKPEDEKIYKHITVYCICCGTYARTNCKG